MPLLFSFLHGIFPIALFVLVNIAEATMERNDFSPEYREYLSKAMYWIERFGGKIIRNNNESCFISHAGLHMRVKYDFERLFQNALARSLFANELKLHIYVPGANVVAGDISMGAFLGEVQHMFLFHSRLALAKKKDSGFIFDANCDLREDDRILLVDDVLTTGGTLIDMAYALRLWYAKRFSSDCSPHIVGSAVLLDRSSAVFPRPSLLIPMVPRPLFSLLQDLDSKIYHANECPHCLNRS